MPLEKEEDFSIRYAEFKKEFPKADHYPYAYILDQHSKSSDDGEPSGAAGRPILSYFEKKEIDGCLVLIARYFGGSKLGLPRLRKTFTDLALEALNGLKWGTLIQLNAYHLSLDYSSFEALKRLQSKYDYELGEASFSTKVELVLYSSDTILTPLRAIGLDEKAIVSEEIINRIQEIKL